MNLPAGIPEQIADFKLLAKIGEGGMGAVYRARQVSLDRDVALKLLPREAAHDKGFINRFQEEARASARLAHPNIVQGINVGFDPKSGYWFFAMEFVEGPTIRKLLKDRGRLPEREALEIVRQMALALACAEKHGMVHRDIKPDNILIDPQGQARLADLGLAKRATEKRAGSRVGQAVGTPYYMAPEQIEGKLEQVDIRSDLYALGATLFHMVTGHPPFEGGSSAVIMAQHLTQEPPLAHQEIRGLSTACGLFIQRLMRKRKEDRYQHATDVVAATEELLAAPPQAAPRSRPRRSGRAGGQQGRMRKSGPRRASGPRGEGADSDPDEEAFQDRGGPSGQWTTWIVLGVALLAAGVGAWLLLKNRGGAGGSPTAPEARTQGSSGGTGAAPRPARVTKGLVACYPLDENQGQLLADASGVEPRLDLAWDPKAAFWVPGGVAVRAPGLLISGGPARKVYDQCRKTNALSLELWVRPAQATPEGPAHLLSYAKDASACNLVLAQVKDRFQVLLRTTQTGAAGAPIFSQAASALPGVLAHLVLTREMGGAVVFYLNGQGASTKAEGLFTTWDATHRLALANEPGLGRPWLGEFYLVALYDRALTSTEVRQNFQAGP